MKHVLLICGVGAFAACSSTPKKQNPSGNNGTVGAAGGQVKTDNVTIDIPAGALDAERTITVTATSDAAPEGLDTFSPVYKFEPEGLTFAKPVKVTLKFTGAPDSPHVFWSKAGGEAGYDDLGGTVDGASIQAETSHFSKAVVGKTTSTGQATTCSGALTKCGDTCVDTQTDEPNCGSCGHACAASQTCSAGACVALPTTAITVHTTDFLSPHDATFVAWQAGDGAWTPLTSEAPGSYAFDTWEERYGVLVVCLRDAHDSVTELHAANIFYRTTSATNIDVDCGLTPPAEPTRVVVHGPYTGTAPEMAEGYLGSAYQYGVDTINNEAIFAAFDGSPSVPSNDSTFDWAMIARNAGIEINFFALARDITVNSGVSSPHTLSTTLDLDNDTIALTEHTVTVTDPANHAAMYGHVYFETANDLSVDMRNQSNATVPLSPATFAYQALDPGGVISTDQYRLNVDDYDGQQKTRRAYNLTFHTGADKTATLPPLMSGANVTSASTPYAHPAAITFNTVAGAEAYNVNFGGNVTPLWFVSYDAGWLPPGNGAKTLSVPDFSSVSGWNNAWFTGTPIRWSVDAVAENTLNGGDIERWTSGKFGNYQGGPAR